MVERESYVSKEKEEGRMKTMRKRRDEENKGQQRGEEMEDESAKAQA